MCYFSVERPIFDAEEELRLVIEHAPKVKKEGTNYDDFCKKVKFILCTVNPHEFAAATTYITAPDNGPNEKNTAIKILPCTWIGTFAKQLVGLIQTPAGDECKKAIHEAINVFCNAEYIVAVGVCYAFPNQKLEFADVIISSDIYAYGPYRLNQGSEKQSGTVEPRGPRTFMGDTLRDTFCTNPTHVSKFVVSNKPRCAKFKVGSVISCNNLFGDSTIRDQVHQAHLSGIGGEMEGGELLRLQRDNSRVTVIIIKAVADFADGNKDKRWQFTGAMAAFHYLEYKIENCYAPGIFST